MNAPPWSAPRSCRRLLALVTLPAVGLLETTMMMVAAATVLVVLLLAISARRRPAPVEVSGGGDPLDARHPSSDLFESGDLPSLLGLPPFVLASHASLLRDLRATEAQLADLRMAHGSQRARLERAGALLGKAGVPGLRLVPGDRPADALAARDREIERLRSALSAAESHLLAASSAGAITPAGSPQGSLVPSASSDVPGGPTTLPPQRKHTMSVTRATHQPSTLRRTQSGGPS